MAYFDQCGSLVGYDGLPHGMPDRGPKVRPINGPGIVHQFKGDSDRYYVSSGNPAYDKPVHVHVSPEVRYPRVATFSSKGEAEAFVASGCPGGFLWE